MSKRLARLTSVVGLALTIVLATSGVAQASVFWVLSDASAGDPATAGSISSATSAGGSIRNNLTTVTDESPLAVDREHMYYRSSDTSIGRADLDGANADNNFITGMTNKVRGIAVNDSHVYWTQYVDLSTETDRGVFRLGLAGGVAGAALISDPYSAPSRIAVDGTYIYWVNEPLSNTGIDGRESVSRARLDGSDKIDIYVDPWGGAGQGGQTMYSIAVAGNRLFIGYFGGNITVSTMGGPAPLASANFATLEASQVVNALGMGADSTYLYYSNESPLSSIGRARLDGSAPPEPSFIPTGNGSNIRPWGGVAVEPPPLPVPTTAQTPANNCVTAPKKISTNRTYRLMKAKCRTNLGKSIKATGSYRGTIRGDMAYFRIYKNRKGETMLKMYGTPIKLRLKWASAASGSTPGYRKIKNYRT